MPILRDKELHMKNARLKPCNYVKPPLVSRSGGLTAAVKRGTFHGLIVPVYQSPGKRTLYRLSEVDVLIDDYICTGRINQRQGLLPSEANALFNQASPAG